LLVESGATAVEIAIIDVEIGQVLRGGPDLAAAEARIEQGREVIARELGEQHPDHAEALGELGIVKLMRGDPAAGRELLERSLALLRATYGVEHPAIAPALNNLAVLEGEVGNYARARALLLESLDVERKRYGDDNLVTAPTLVNLASAALWMDEPKLALVELEKAETIFRAADPVRPELAGVYRQKSYALGELGRATEAVADAVRAVELFDKHRSADDPRRADARTQLGAARLLAGDRDGASVAYDEAVAILERGAARSPAITAMLASTLEARAEVHAAAGDGAAAEADRTRAKSLTIPAGTPVRSQ
jgi:tetratricopeptide (TPR) repeat protein